MAWLKTGEMFKQCDAKGCSVRSPPLGWTVDDRVELANETVAVALNSFKQNALREGKWTSNGGGTLKTYFIGSCILAFPNVYRKWSTGRVSLQHLTSLEHGAIDRLNPPQDPGEMAITRLRIQEGFNGIPDERTKSAVILQGMGYTYAEIGEILEITSRAVDGLIRRQHQRGGGHHD
jgi:DNA-directed RNA polymerase specialized sigma24 family protein